MDKKKKLTLFSPNSNRNIGLHLIMNIGNKVIYSLSTLTMCVNINKS